MMIEALLAPLEVRSAHNCHLPGYGAPAPHVRPASITPRLVIIEAMNIRLT